MVRHWPRVLAYRLAQKGVGYLARMLLSEVGPALGALGPPPPYPAAPGDRSRFPTAAFGLVRKKFRVLDSKTSHQGAMEWPKIVERNLEKRLCV